MIKRCAEAVSKKGARLSKPTRMPRRWPKGLEAAEMVPMNLLLPHRSDSGMGKSAKRIPFALSVSCCAVTAAFPDVAFDVPPLGPLPAMAAQVSLPSRDVFKICLCLK